MQLADTTNTVNPVPIHSVRRCLSVVARHYGLKPAEMRERDRRRKIVVPRQLAMWLAYQLKAYSLSVIGGHLGGYDHTTVLHAVRSIEQRRKDEAYRQFSDAMLKEVHNPTVAPPEEPAPCPPAALPRSTLQTFMEKRLSAGDVPVRFYSVGPEDPRYWRSFLIKQNERFCAAMREACK
jgi:hypothetical protein